MRDTSPEMEERYRAMLMARSREERLKMGDSMYATARALVIASITERDPSISPAALRQAVFLRFYGHEFDAATRERILRRLAEPEAAGEAEERGWMAETERIRNRQGYTEPRSSWGEDS